MKQHRHEKLSEFKRRFEASVDVLEHIGANFGGGLVDIADEIVQKVYNETRKNTWMRKPTEQRPRLSIN